MPGTRNRPIDVLGVETALKGAGFLGLDQGRRRQNLGVFDSRLDGAVRTFQRRHKLKVDGLLLPKGPTRQALNRILERAAAKTKPAPPLKGLSGEAVSANARLVRHLMGTTADGLVPGLMAADFSADQAGRAKTADFLSQLFGRDPARARSLHAQARGVMRGLMSAGEKTLLDKLILQARKADADALAQPPGDPDDDEPEEPEEPTPDDPGQDDPDEPDQDDEPEEPDDPEEPPKKPEKPDCQAIIDALRTLIKELKEVRDELAPKKEKFNENQARISELEKEEEKKKAALNALLAAQSLAVRSKSPSTLIRITNKITETRDKLEKIKGELEPLIKENEALKPEIEELEERERQKVENQRILEARLEECRAQTNGN